MTDFITYKEPKMAKITSINDSMHCYAQHDLVEILAEFIEDGKKWYVAQQTGADCQQQITKDEWLEFNERDIKLSYIGKMGELCGVNESANKSLIHFFQPYTDVKILKHVSGTICQARCMNEGFEQHIDIRDLTFNI